MSERANTQAGDKTRQGKARRNKTGQDKTRDTTRHDKTRKDKTGPKNCSLIEFKSKNVRICSFTIVEDIRVGFVHRVIRVGVGCV